MRVFIAGDFCPRFRVSECFEKKDYAKVLQEVTRFTKESDYSIVNFECPVATQSDIPIVKSGPNLRCSTNAIQAILYAGFNCVTLANNHFRDFGDNACIETLDSLNAYSIDYVGGGRNLHEAQETKYVELDGKRLALINVCENEYSIASEEHAGSNPLNPVQQYYAIVEAKKKADYVLVIVHGGHECFQLPSPRMVETYRFFIDAGADAVVNHHQHCFSGYEVYQNKPIFYGLGNFCFDDPANRKGTWTEGFAVTLDFSTPEPSFEIHPYIQCANKPSVVFLDKNSFDNRIQELNSIIASKDKLEKEVFSYYHRSTAVIEAMFEPFKNRLYMWLKTRGLLPSFIRRNDKERIRNSVTCEAHRDKLMFWLKS